MTLTDESVNKAQCDYHYKYAEATALVELVSHIEDSRLLPVLERSTLQDMYRTRVHQVKSTSIRGGDSSEKMWYHYMETQ